MIIYFKSLFKSGDHLETEVGVLNIVSTVVSTAYICYQHCRMLIIIFFFMLLQLEQ